MFNFTEYFYIEVEYCFLRCEGWINKGETPIIIFYDNLYNLSDIGLVQIMQKAECETCFQANEP